MPLGDPSNALRGVYNKYSKPAQCAAALLTHGLFFQQGMVDGEAGNLAVSEPIIARLKLIEATVAILGAALLLPLLPLLPLLRVSCSPAGETPKCGVAFRNGLSTSASSCFYTCPCNRFCCLCCWLSAAQLWQLTAGGQQLGASSRQQTVRSQNMKQ